MLSLKAAVAAWGKKDFKAILKQSLEGLQPSALPLHLCTNHGGYIGDAPVSVTVNGFNETADTIEGTVGVFFTEIMINCGCGDDPVDMNAFCELRLSINKQTALTEICIEQEDPA